MNTRLVLGTILAVLFTGCGSVSSEPTCWLEWRDITAERPCYVEFNRTRNSGSLYIGLEEVGVRVFFFERPHVGSIIPIHGSDDGAQILVEDIDGGICTTARDNTDDQPPYSEVRFASVEGGVTVEIEAYVQCEGSEGWRYLSLAADIAIDEEG